MLRNALALALMSLALAGCAKKADPEKSPDRSKLASQEVPASKVEGARVVVTLTVDWEGAYLSPDALKAMQAFRERWKQVPFTHFICPAYFARGGDNKAFAAQIREQVKEGDEVGLHLHSWFSLAAKAGVTPREGPNFYGDDEDLMTLEDGDRGYEVSLSAYNEAEVAKLVKTSVKLLEENGLGRANSFRAGGYIGTPEVMAAVRAANILVDSSATWPTWFDSSRRSAGGEVRGLQFSELKKAWPNIDELTQPYGIDTSAGALIEVPNTGSFPEYAPADEMLGHLQRAMLASKAQGATIYVDFGFHQESADEFIGIISSTLQSFEKSYPGVLSFSTISAVANAAVGE